MIFWEHRIAPNHRMIIYCTAIKYGTQAEWNFLYERYRKSVGMQQDIMLSALGCSREQWILKR